MRLLIIILLVVSCGKREPLGFAWREITTVNEAHRRINNTNRELELQEKQLEKIKQQIEELYSLIASNVVAIDDLNAVAVQLQEQSDLLKTAMEESNQDTSAEIASLMASNEANITSINNTIESIENDILLSQIRISQLESNENITDIIDPCGDKANAFDEVILKTSSGKLMAYFESGSKRFLTILSNGSYRTTDAQTCSFDVEDGVISY